MSAQVVLDNWGQQDREGRNIDVGFQNHKKIIVPLHWVGNVPQKMNKPVSFGILLVKEKSIRKTSYS